ncbi:MAG: flagellin [Pseudomonadota bacterium]
MSVINTNVKSLVAQNALTVNSRNLSKTMEQLSTGKRINGASDDAAGLAISNKMTSQIKGLNQAVRNANDGISMIQTAEGATKEVTNMLQRVRELAVQAANDTYDAADRTAMQDEVGQLEEEITRIATNTKWNGMSVLSSAQTKNLQVGMENATDSTIELNLQDMTASGLDVSGLDLSSHTAAQAVLDKVDTAIATVDSFRSDLGSKMNRLNYAADNMSNVSLNTAASRSRIEDTDYAQTTTELARSQIIQQAATAMLAQANQQPSSVLSLLQ